MLFFPSYYIYLCTCDLQYTAPCVVILIRSSTVQYKGGGALELEPSVGPVK